MLVNDVRQTFINYFKDKHAHQYVHSSGTIPYDDPTLLFANAGMNQFKPIFLGTVDPSSDMAKLSRAVNSQKCIRAGGKHNDLDDVGKDLYHHTFFEMLGNWSFGDYFKQEICSWSWDLLTNVYGLPKDRLYVTYFGGESSQGLEPDDECKQMWIELGVPIENILPGNIKDNFWEMGDTGPCGPCSEIHFDRIGGRNAADLVNQDDPDVIEIWNLVFIQFNRENDGKLKSLPKKHIDCGLGLERLTSILQNKRSNYDTDIFLPIFDAIQKLTGVRPYTGKIGKDDVDGIDMAYRVLADHARTLTIALSDGGMPDNVGRGYVLRRILRRAVRFASEKLKAKSGMFASLVTIVVEILKDAFPEVAKDPAYIMDIINEEENQFLKTLERGRKLLQRTISKLDNCKLIPGDVAWRLYDTYGFPVDLTQLMAEDYDLNIDMDSFEECKKKAQELSKGENRDKDNSYRLDVHAIEELKTNKVDFTDDSVKYNYSASVQGDYTFESCTAKIVVIRHNGQFVQQVKSGDRCGIVTDRTSFYAESGGQMSDEGFMMKVGDEETEFKIETAEIKGGYVCHIGVVEGTLKVNDSVSFSFDGERRRLLMNNHTGTHILNFALRQILLSDADQRGSLVAPDRLRFDFTNKGAVTVDQVKKIESIAQNVVNENSVVYAKSAQLAVAKSIQGLRAVFGEVYPDPVRVVSVGIPVEDLVKDPHSESGSRTSIEFCGGTHLLRAGHIGDFVITSEEAIAKGIRRIVALTGPEAAKAVRKGEILSEQVSSVKNFANSNEVSYREAVKLITDKIDEINKAQLQYWYKDQLRQSLEATKKSLGDADRARKLAMSKNTVQLTKQIVVANPDIPYLVMELNAFAQNKVLNDALKEVKNGPPSLFLSTDEDTGKILAMAAVPKDVVKKGLSADEWVKCLTDILNGKGGGRPESAQISGTNVSALSDALILSEKFAQEKLKCNAAKLIIPTVTISPNKNTDGDSKEINVAAPTKKKSKKEGKEKTTTVAEEKAPIVALKKTSSVVLNSGGNTYQGLSCLIAAKYSGIELSVGNSGAEKCVLETPEGRLEGAVAPAMFLAPVSLKGSDALHQAQVLSWVLSADSELLPLIASGIFSSKPPKGAACSASLQLGRLNMFLRDHTFLVGERLSMADIAVFCVLVPVFSSHASAVKDLHCVTRWYNTVLHQKYVQAVVTKRLPQ
uniref:Alanine--tRNA ligase n=1 Tax=Hirondellea gigas TaxID=1518452 RepID=A0A2P2I2B3_9CRUS